MIVGLNRSLLHIAERCADRRPWATDRPHKKSNWKTNTKVCRFNTRVLSFRWKMIPSCKNWKTSRQKSATPHGRTENPRRLPTMPKSAAWQKMASLRKILLKSYVIQIDSLTEPTNAWWRRIPKSQTNTRKQTKPSTKVRQEKESLNEKVTAPSKLDATGISIRAVNKKRKRPKEDRQGGTNHRVLHHH